MKLWRWAPAFGLFAAGAALSAAALSPVYALAGHYHFSFRNGLVTGEHYRSTDTADIVPIDAGHAYVDFQLYFYNGHECSLGGVARVEGRRLVYRDPQWRGEDGSPCTLRIWRDGRRLRWTDGENSCKALCGARGSFMDGEMAWSTRRPVTARERARSLSDYRRRGATR